MKIMSRIKAKIYGWNPQPSKKEAEKLADRYEDITKGISNKLKKEDAINLIRISRYADMGEMRALDISFKIGYSEGQTELKDKISEHFESGVR